MGHNPTDSQVNDMINEVDIEGAGNIHFDQFMRFVVRLSNTLEVDTIEDLLQAYRRFVYEK